jgi:putative DNA primase/helicase
VPEPTKSAASLGPPELMRASTLVSSLTARGTVGSGEQQSAVRQVRHFIELHGASRFLEIHPTITPAMLRKPNGSGFADEEDSHLSDRWINNMAGYKKTEKGGATAYLIWPEVWRQEVCKGMDGEQAAKALHDRGLLTKDLGKGHWTKKMRLPGDEKTYRFFVVSSAILAADDEEADE